MGISAIRSPLKINCYTCMSFETCWSRLIYTKLSSHKSFVINMYVLTMAWRCISPWSLNRSLQRRRVMDIFGYSSRFPRIVSKKQPKKLRKPQLNTRKHWESESRNRSLSAAVLHVKPSHKNGNLYNTKIITKWRFWTTQYPCSAENGTGISSQSINKIQLFSGSLSRARTLYWLWALRFISLDNKML